MRAGFAIASSRTCGDRTVRGVERSRRTYGDRRYAGPMNDTPAIRAAAESGIDFEIVRTPRPNSVVESAALQGIEVGELLRTIVVRRGADDYVFVLVPGGRQIDWPKLRAHLGVKRISLPGEAEAKEATGYERGAITPFGSITPWPVVADTSVSGLHRVAIGGGGRGVNLHMAARDLVAYLNADVADVTDPVQPPG